MKLLDRLARNRAAIARTGEDRWLSAASYLRYRAADRMIAEHARGRVLDIGCGHMPFRAQVLRYASSYEGLDVEPRTEGVAYVRDVQDLTDLAANAFDTVLCFEVLEHISDPAQALAQIARLMVPSGRLLVTVPHLSRLHEQPHDYYRYTEYGLRSLAQRAGLRVDVLSSYGGLASFIGHQGSTLLRTASHGIPVLDSVARVINRAVGITLPQVLDRITDPARVFPLGYAMVARK